MARGALPVTGVAYRVLFGPGGRVRAVWRLTLYLLALVAGLFVAQGVLYPLLLPIARAVTVRPALQRWIELGGVTVAHVICLRVVERRPWADVRVGRAALRAAPVAVGTLLGLVAIAVPTGLLLAAGAYRVVPAAAGSSLANAAALAGVLAPAALFEELLVRGYPFLVLRESLGPLPALLLTSVVFGGMHWWNPGATLGTVGVVTLAGIFLGAVLLATGSLWAAFAAHLAWNWSLAGIFHASVSGLPFATPDYRLIDAGPDWLTGGAWGPEGGAGAAAGMLGALAVLHFRASRTRRVEHGAAHAALAGRALPDRADTSF